MNRKNLDIVVRNLLEIYPPLMKKINTGDYIKQFELTPNLTRILFILKFQSELSLSELSDRMVMSRSNCSRAVDNLEKNDYVKRKTDPQDKRKTLLVLTEAGEKTVEDLNRKIREEIKVHMSELSEEDIMTLKKASEQIHEVLSKLN